MAQLKAQMLLTLRDRLSGKLSRVRRQMKDISGDQRRMRRDFSETAKASSRMGLEQAAATRKVAASQSELIQKFRALKQQAVSTRDRLTGVQSKLKALSQAGKTTGTEFRRLRNEAGRLKQSLKTNETGLETLRRKLNSTGISSRNLANASRSAGQALRSSTNAVNSHEQALARMERRQRAVLRLTNRLRDRRNDRLALGAGMGAAGIAGIYAGRQGLRPVQSTVSEFATFEEQMDAVAAVARVQKGSKDYLALAGKARELGASTSFSAQEVASGMQFQAMAGFSKDAILTTIEDVLNLARATKSDLAQTSDISSNIMSSFGLEPKEMRRVADVLTATTTRANVDLSMLGDTMKYVGPEAKDLGVSLEEAAAMAGLLGNAGLQGSLAGTSLRGIYQRLAAPNTAGQKALKQLGIETKDLQGNLRPVPELILEIAKATEGLGSGDRKQIFKDIIGMEAGTGFSALVDEQGFAVFEKLLADLKVSQGEAKRVSQAMGNNLSGDVKGLLSAFSELKLVIGEELNPAIRSTVKWLTEATRQTSAWLKENPALARGIGFAAIAIAGLLIVGGGLLAFLGSATIMLAGLRFGLQMLGLKAMASAGSVGLLGRMFGALSLLKPIRWALLIPKLAWRLFITPLKWAAFLPRLAWRAIVPALTWSGLIGKISWAALAGRLSWRLLILPLKWGARLIPVIGWALLAGELLWHLLIKPLGWDKYVPELSWDNFVKALDWLSWLTPIRWLDFIPGFSWTEILGGAARFDWSDWIARLSWQNFTEALTWSNFLSLLEWSQWVHPIRWFNFIRAFSWKDKLSELKPLDWSGWIPGIDWSGIASGFDWDSILGDMQPIDWKRLLVPTVLRTQIDAIRALFDIDLFDVGQKIITSLLDGMKAVFAQLMAWVNQKIAELKNAFTFNISMPSLFGGSAPANDNRPAKDVTGGPFSKGGTVLGSGVTMVGERGPELRYLNKGEFIAHHGQLKEMAMLSRQVKSASSAGGPIAYQEAAPILPRLATAAGRSEGSQASSGSTANDPGRAEHHTTNHNTFHIHGSDPEAIAKEISAIMERQSRRRMSD